MRSDACDKDPTAVKMQQEEDDDVSKSCATICIKAGTKSVPGPKRTAWACIGDVEDTTGGSVPLLATVEVVTVSREDMDRKCLG